MLDAEDLAQLFRIRARALQDRALSLEQAGRREGWSPAARDPALYRVLAEQFGLLADDIARLPRAD